MGKELVVDHHLDLAKAGLCHWEILRNLGAEIYYEDLRETRIVGNNGMEVCGLRLVAQLCWDEVFLAGALFDISVSLRSEEHTSELQSLMRISYAVFCLKKKTTQNVHTCLSLDSKISLNK